MCVNVSAVCVCVCVCVCDCVCVCVCVCVCMCVWQLNDALQLPKYTTELVLYKFELFVFHFHLRLHYRSRHWNEFRSYLLSPQVIANNTLWWTVHTRKLKFINFNGVNSLINLMNVFLKWFDNQYSGENDSNIFAFAFQIHWLAALLWFLLWWIDRHWIWTTICKVMAPPGARSLDKILCIPWVFTCRLYPL